jgi:hypothetical protein
LRSTGGGCGHGSPQKKEKLFWMTTDSFFDTFDRVKGALSQGRIGHFTAENASFIPNGLNH